MSSPADIPLFNFKHLGLEDPPFYGAVEPLYKEGDPASKRPQETPFFNSIQFKLWQDDELVQYNQLIDVLVKWRNRGWAEFTETSEWIESKENWISWIKYYTILQVPAEEMHLHLYEMNIMRMPIPETTTQGAS